MSHLPPLPVIVAFLVAFVASFSRIFAASKPFWALFPAWFQVFAPQLSLAIGAVGAGLAGGVNSWTDLAVAFVASGALLLPGLPSNRSSAPLPGRPKSPSVPPFGVGMLTLCLSLFGLLALCSCSSLSAKGAPVWPVLVGCAPSAPKLLHDAETILLTGGDYEARLAELAKSEGASFVQCAVQAAVDALLGKYGAGPNEAAAVARGKAFLAKVSAK